MKLSICIPTFNRQASLVRLLSKLSKIDPLGYPNLDIYVADNSETRLASQDIPLDLHINYNWHNGQNIGYGANLLYLFNLVYSGYILFLSDDDYPDISQIQNLYSYLQSVQSPLNLLLCYQTASGKKSLVSKHRSIFRNVLHLTYISSFILYKNPSCSYRDMSQSISNIFFHVNLLSECAKTSGLDIAPFQSPLVSINPEWSCQWNPLSILKSYHALANKIISIFGIVSIRISYFTFSQLVFMWSNLILFKLFIVKSSSILSIRLCLLLSLYQIRSLGLTFFFPLVIMPFISVRSIYENARSADILTHSSNS